ncbi:MAG: hypothetical protein U0228_23080 [Myxococcaceae bacterium]
MRRPLLLLALLVGCESPPPPPPPPPPAPPKDAGPPPAPEPEPEPEPQDDEPDTVEEFPEAPEVPTLTTDEELMTLLLIDPRVAEERLANSDKPDAFRVALLSEFARARGDANEPVAEALIPLAATADAGVPTGAGPAWAADDGVVLKKAAATVARLPLDTPVQVLSVKGPLAEIELNVASVAVYDENGSAPRAVESQLLRGQVKLSDLRSSPMDRDGLLARARAASTTAEAAGATDEQKLQAVALWQRVLRAVPMDSDDGAVMQAGRAREGLLHAAFTARRASSAVAAALSRELVSGKSVSAYWACEGTPPPKSVLTNLKKSFDAHQCMTWVDERKACTPADEKRLKALEQFKTLAKADLGTTGWLRFKVDARRPRRLLLVSTPLVLADRCSDFEEVKLDTGAGRVRRLAVPLGTATLDVWVPIARTLGVDHSLITAASELNAVEWLRSRQRYRWTVGKNGDLQPSLGVDTLEFALRRDVEAITWAVPPDHSCGCEE